MYFEKSKEKELSKELFKNPTAEYRGAPFWAWNSKLEKQELARQIDIFKQMGFGGFNMHVRQGLETPYLGEGYMDAIRFCAEKAQKEGMTAWLYDEDRWPSGVAGGFVTKNPEYRQKFIKMCFADKPDCADTKEQAKKTGKPYFLVAFSVQIDSDKRACYFKQVNNGKLMRMALILKLLDESSLNKEEDRFINATVTDKKCKNTRCITNTEQEIVQYVKRDEELGVDRCIYCDAEI
jgi:hypothetical protein